MTSKRSWERKCVSASGENLPVSALFNGDARPRLYAVTIHAFCSYISNFMLFLLMCVELLLLGGQQRSRSLCLFRAVIFGAFKNG